MTFLSRLRLAAVAVFASVLLAGATHASEQLYLAINDPQHYHHSNCSLLRAGATIVEAGRASTLAPCPICKPSIEMTSSGVGAAMPAPTAVPAAAPQATVPQATPAKSSASTSSGSTSTHSKVTTSTSGGTVQVKGYYRKDGTYVKSHTRKKAKPRKPR
jgi:hypothetical protein